MNAEERLRRILAAEAESVDVAPDALEVIRARVARRRARWWRGWLPRGAALLSFAGGGAVVAAATVVAFFVGTHHPAPPPQIPGGSAPAVAKVPVYFAGTTGLGLRLYREYHPPSPDADLVSRTRTALAAMFDPNGAADPDYRTLWPAGVTVRAVQIAGDTVTVDLAGVPVTPPGDEATVGMAREQLVWTATAASGTTRMKLLLDGHGVARLWGMADLDAPLQRGNRPDVLAPVWLIDPQQGATVGHTVTVYVAGIVPDATVRVRVRGANGAVLDERSVPLSAGAPQQGEARLQLSLPSGRYTVEAYVLAPDGRTERYLDDHQVTVG
ncbi:MAG: hypothetical protein AUI14_03065 [Actinobacteria bacterium 13_2_20CM_2_71_6]|nr:MAG: hypothetical protein AUI14_03065 [Actinobacteria bacterium 13_2_20CM_2_71_6]